MTRLRLSDGQLAWRMRRAAIEQETLERIIPSLQRVIKASGLSLELGIHPGAIQLYPESGPLNHYLVVAGSTRLVRCSVYLDRADPWVPAWECTTEVCWDGNSIVRLHRAFAAFVAEIKRRLGTC